MTGLALGGCLGLGLFLVWWSCWTDPAHGGRPATMSLVGKRLRRSVAAAEAAGLTPLRYLALCLGSALAGGVAAAAATRVLPIAVILGLGAGALPPAVFRARARRRRRLMAQAWPEVVDHVASGVRAGLALPEALAALQDRGPSQLRPAFADFAADYRVEGHFGDCLDRLKQRLADPVADRLVESLRIARDVGGSDLGRLLRTLSGFLREDQRLRSELEARQSWTVNAARLAVSAPWIVLLVMSTRPSTLLPYRRPEGAMVLVAGAVITLLAYRVMRRLSRLPDDERAR